MLTWQHGDAIFRREKLPRSPIRRRPRSCWIPGGSLSTPHDASTSTEPAQAAPRVSDKRRPSATARHASPAAPLFALVLQFSNPIRVTGRESEHDSGACGAIVSKSRARERSTAIGRSKGPGMGEHGSSSREADRDSCRTHLELEPVLRELAQIGLGVPSVPIARPDDVADQSPVDDDIGLRKLLGAVLAREASLLDRADTSKPGGRSKNFRTGAHSLSVLIASI